MAYNKFEQTYVDAYLNNMYPDVEEEQSQDTMLAAGPTAEPDGQVTVSGFKPQQVKTDVQPALGVARPIPQNKAQEALGYIGELLTKAGVQLDKVGIDIPVLGRISLKDLTVGESGKVLEDMALGFYPIEGAGGFISGTTRIKPDPAFELLNIAPIAGAAAKVAGKGVVKAGQAVAPKAAEMAEGYMRSIGGIADIVPPSPKPVSSNVSELGFYSAAKEAVDSIQQPKGTGEQFLKQIEKTPGVKPEEIKWTGLDDFLKSKKSVTKVEVQEFLDKNRVEVKEVRLGEQETYDPSRLKQLEEEYSNLKQHPIDDPSFGEEKYDEMIRLMNIRDRSTTDSLYRSQESAERAAQRAKAKGMPEAAERYFRQAELFNTRAEKLDLEGLGMDAPTKFSKYTLPGGENYREILITLPSKSQFDPEKVEIARNRQSVTQGSYTIKYDNKEIGTFSDDLKVSDNYKGYSDEQIMNHAKSLYEKGSPYSGIKPISTNFKSQHFDQPNILAHLRVNDRVDADGKKVLFVEEVQSDWHQAGRKKGYNTPEQRAADQKKLDALDAERENLRAEQARLEKLAKPFTDQGKDAPSDILDQWNMVSNRLNNLQREYAPIANQLATGSGVPDAPFKTTWHELSMKRAIQLAAEGGYDRVAFTTGKTQAERYDLSKQISEVHLSGTDLVAYDKNGDTVIKQTGVTKDNLADYIGKEPAQKLLDQKPQGTLRSISGVDLQVGGEGMKGFYDQILPKFLDKYAKKWDGKVGKTNIQADGDSVAVQYIDVTPKMKESVLTKGQPLFAIGAGGAAVQQEDNQ